MKIVYTCLQVYHGRPWGPCHLSVCAPVSSLFQRRHYSSSLQTAAGGRRQFWLFCLFCEYERFEILWSLTIFCGVYPRNEMTETFKNCIWNVNSTCIVLTVGSWYIHVFLLRKDEKKRNIYNWYWGLSIYIQ